MCHQFYLTRRITTRRGANFWPRKRTQETHKQTQNSSQEVSTQSEIYSAHSHYIWKWLEVIYLPRLSLLADSTHFLLCVVLWCHSLNNRWQQSTVFPDAWVAIASNSLWPCLKYKRELHWPEEQQHKSVWAERTAPRDNTYISLHHHNAILRMLVLQKCILHLKVGY